VAGANTIALAQILLKHATRQRNTLMSKEHLACFLFLLRQPSFLSQSPQAKGITLFPVKQQLSNVATHLDCWAAFQIPSAWRASQPKDIKILE